MQVKEKEKRIHFVGIGGAGMSGIAAVLLGMGGYRVSGSDLKRTAVVERLENLGATCYTGHAAENLMDVDMVITSTAISPDNPEVLEAQRRGIPLVRRGAMLARLMNEKRGIAVAGAHGKTTTTSMISLVLEKSGFDPTILIGGDLSDIGGNAKQGQGEYLVAEADESDGSFLLLSPEIAVVTNIEDDHLDHYGSKENIIKAFMEFLNKVPAKGLSVLCLDDPVIKTISTELSCPVVTYGSEDSGADYILSSYEFRNGISRAVVTFRGERLGVLELVVPGYHNLLNALATVATGRYLGLDFEQVARSLAGFKGAKRRYQLLGETKGIKIVDDYAHHPTEIKATLQAARHAHPGRLLVVFQPHRYTRTRQLFREFGESFHHADVIILTDIYSAGEPPLEGVDTRLIIDAISRKEGQQVLYLPTLKDAAEFLQNNLQGGDLVLTMGAGDVYTLGRELLRRLEEK
ncbi:UDP-N-acetylmuramate--L-alanine ligase [Desulforamulus ruminis]|uniref:UDP-N-acetylmuramate--L-alanine ligase n=1 Tax=Desulforamulus ruminis (strain ATCC 23193 / DSM 2154 / NCIMB 8452 / DL) TaxID=696281 RepID=F6DKD4_DESRL|nr:UDP-N-acetylmuramate--L-alanine ligase [Desulforamulus ruminis]AEG61551.1 UDP-N-acetylmuramate/alanine ligase [Desulforamulus ruminis DSM 2154]